MEELNNEQKVELRSEEVQEIMGQIPPWIQQWGLTVLLGLVIMFFVICYFLRFPQILIAEITLTSATPPVELHAHTTGKLTYMGVVDKQIVKKDEILAVIQNTANYNDIQNFKKMYVSWKNGEIGLDSLLLKLNERQWQMGELQSVFLEFFQSAENYIIFHQRNYFPQKIALMGEERNKHNEMELQWEQEFHLISEQEKVARKIFIRDSILYKKKIGTEEDFDEARKSYLQSRQVLLDNARQQKEMDMQRIEDKKLELDLQNQYEETIKKHEQELLMAAERIDVQLNSWEQTYTLKSPIDGIVNLMGIWSENQYVTNGELVFIILPKKPDHPFGKAWLPASGAGKVEVGQRVNVRLNNFPDEEYGFLIGRVRSISSIPNDASQYFVSVEFPDGLLTNYRKELPPSKQMVGTAEIITEDKRLIEKIVEPISKIIKEQKRNE